MKDALPIERKLGVYYDYFSDKYTSRYQFFGPSDYDKLKSEVEHLKNQLEELGYDVNLDKQYGLRLEIKTKK